MARMLLFLGLVTVLIAAGSLYPFLFDWTEFDRPWLDGFLATWGDSASRGDVIGNLLLFAPWGLAGVMRGPMPVRRRPLAIGLLVSGVVFAAALQVTQIAVPGRTPSITDIWLNTGGIAIGLALWLGGARLPTRALPSLFPISGLILAGLWLAATAMPLVPTIDWQAWKDSLKPLLLNPEFDVVVFLSGTAGWLAVGALLETPQTVRTMPLVLLAGGVVSAGLQVIAVSATVSVSNVASVIAAAALWQVLQPLSQPQRRGIAAALLLGAWIVSELEPFSITAWANPFFILPFVELLHGNIETNLSNLIATAFVFAAFAVLMRDNRMPLGASAILLAIVGLLCELAQVHLEGRSPGVTNAVLPLVVAAVIALIPATGWVRPAEALAPAPARTPSQSIRRRRAQDPWTPDRRRR